MQNNSKDDLKEEVILENLSFYEWISIEKLLIDLGQSDLTLIGELTLDELKNILDSLVKRGQLTVKHEQKEAFYKREHPPKGIKGKIKRFLK